MHFATHRSLPADGVIVTAFHRVRVVTVTAFSKRLITPRSSSLLLTQGGKSDFNCPKTDRKLANEGPVFQRFSHNENCIKTETFRQSRSELADFRPI